MLHQGTELPGSLRSYKLLVSGRITAQGAPAGAGLRGGAERGAGPGRGRKQRSVFCPHPTRPGAATWPFEVQRVLGNVVPGPAGAHGPVARSCLCPALLHFAG